MPESLARIPLRCDLCNKPFDKRSTLTRHGYYCRSRRTGRAVRSRSCIACAKNKARCDNGQPSCSRCTAKVVQCCYPRKATSTTPSTAVASHEQRRSSLGSVQDHIATSGEVDTNVNDAPATTTSQVPESEERLLSWNDMELASLGQNIDWENLTLDVDFLDDETDAAAGSYPVSSVDHSLQMQHTMALYNTPVPSIPDIYSPRSLVSRPGRDPGQQRIANLVLQTLKSYPLMIIRHDALPPFIHSCSTAFHGEEENMESLTNCLNLMHMLGSSIRGSSKLFWKNVRWECERIREQHVRMNPWELLAAMQALSVYLLVRLQEGETEHNNYDSLILTTVIMIAQDLTRTALGCDARSTVRGPSIETSWRAWIFQESRKRLAAIYRIVNMLIYFEPASMCELQKELIIAPLPAKKQLWEAKDERIWDEMATRNNGVHESLALAADGELIRLDQKQIYCNNGVVRYGISHDPRSTSTTTDWESWCSGMDGFGSLIMLAASLIV